ncbi:2-oxoglutarate dehydrogenase complex dihydrolipoyllysine-residue succinyltransferase [Alkalihalobacillus sp. LMS39]|uniref:2-oxoglutarate dehydrogenase complex dihydrolipoyllysine-residue succinyltransferase n=1 Tax=Alkalihalobacillus sp. LMS39 TaxID=2924032 RepID=UPI001FB3ED2F|nr:2-oxoglutarate dehydrogenase complex dihydrolipoyllysine-residue succinyltransferase [Alkalihalobacillus sp. LMS39]UOE92588.1 2-oxoglutarate dehydrogenase complex dihydrolipoyllysine-residue succinyltransferase [Alkalihalobacillus sp. LMS39]
MKELKVPELAESISEGTIAQWLVEVGDSVSKGDYVVELETDKVNIEVTAEASGIIKEQVKEQGDTVKVGEVIALIDETEKESTTEEKQQSDEVKKSNSGESEQETEKKKFHDPIASPAARKLAREKGLSLERVKTTDPLGRVRKPDVENHSEKEEKTSSPTEHKQEHPHPSEKPIEKIKMSRRRQTIANRLMDVQQNTAMLTTFNEVDMTAIMDIRKRHQPKFQEEHDMKLGYMSFFTKAIIAGLKKYPLLNAEIQGDDIIVKKHYDIGVAVSTEEGLVVPVVRDADRLDFASIEKEIARLAEKSREKKLSLSDLQGGTFTITNGGIFGSLLSTPILNTPQVGILGMHKIQWRPVAIDKEKMENRPMMYIALSYDHRIIDGKEAVSFLVKIKELLENPEVLLLQG